MSFSGHYDRVGKGPAVLCFAGFGCSNYLFDFLSEDLAGSYTFIMPDNRGMGKSPDQADPYEIEDLARDGLELMDDLGFNQFHVIGISMGGFITMALNGLAPDRIASIALCCTMGPGSDFEPMQAITKEQLDILYALPAGQRAQLSVKNTTHPSLASENPVLFQQIVAMRLANPSRQDQAMHQFDAVLRFLDKPYDFGSISAPVLAICGAQDRTVPPQNSQILARKVPRGIHRCIDRSDHLFFLEKRSDVAREIDQFFSGSIGM